MNFMKVFSNPSKNVELPKTPAPDLRMNFGNICLTASDNNGEVTVTVEKEEPKYIWVDGYKGMEDDMTCRGYQYEIGKTYKHEGQIALCYSGFHFCTELKEVFPHYDLDFSNRFFKVRGLVLEEDFNNIGKYKESLGFRGYRNTIDSKLSAKEIEIIEELKFEDVKNFIDEKYYAVKTEEDYNICKEIGFSDFAKKVYLECMKELGFTEAFALVLSYEVTDNQKQRFCEVARAYCGENMSKDMLIYLLLDEVKQMRGV